MAIDRVTKGDLQIRGPTAHSRTGSKSAICFLLALIVLIGLAPACNIRTHADLAVEVRESADHRARVALISLSGKPRRFIDNPDESVGDPSVDRSGERLAVWSWGVPQGRDVSLTAYAMRNWSVIGQHRLSDCAGSPASWSPDGTQLVFVDGRPPCEGEYSLKSLSVKDGSLATLMSSESALSGPDWSPDGETIAFTAYGTSGQPAGICELEVKSGAVSCVIEATSTELNYSPSYSPDGMSIAYIHNARTDGRGTTSVMVVGRETGVSRPLYGPTTNEDYTNVSWSRDGTALAIGTHDGEVQLLDSNTGAELSRISPKPSRWRILPPERIYYLYPTWATPTP